MVTVELTRQEAELLVNAMDSINYAGDIKSRNQVLGYIQAIIDLQAKIYNQLFPEANTVSEPQEEVAE
jgi:hypothetical protein